MPEGAYEEVGAAGVWASYPSQALGEFAFLLLGRASDPETEPPYIVELRQATSLIRVYPDSPPDDDYAEMAEHRITIGQDGNVRVNTQQEVHPGVLAACVNFLRTLGSAWEPTEPTIEKRDGS